MSGAQCTSPSLKRVILRYASRLAAAPCDLHPHLDTARLYQLNINTTCAGVSVYSLLPAYSEVLFAFLCTSSDDCTSLLLLQNLKLKVSFSCHMMKRVALCQPTCCLQSGYCGFGPPGACQCCAFRQLSSSVLLYTAHTVPQPMA